MGRQDYGIGDYLADIPWRAGKSPTARTRPASGRPRGGEIARRRAPGTKGSTTRRNSRSREVAALERALRHAGLLTGPAPQDLYLGWLENAARRDIATATILEIACTHGIGPTDFDVLAGLTPFIDPEGKAFFLIEKEMGSAAIRRAVLMTYVFNAGTDYGSTGRDNDFDETPYSAAEIQRVIDRQARNDWSYTQDALFVHGSSGRLVTTPNGMLMGLGGNRLLGLYSQRGGTTYGDVFLLNIRHVPDPAEALGSVVTSGRAVYQRGRGEPYRGRLRLDRLLHHEELHSQQWARKGYLGFIGSYTWEQLRRHNSTEVEAGLADGGYRR